MRLTALVASLLLASLSLHGCASSPSSLPSVDAAPPPAPRTVDGLVLADIDEAGQLFLREDHGIGGYDAIMIKPSWVSYTRNSANLEPNLEGIYLATLEQSLIDIADGAGMRIATEPGKCVLQIGVGFDNVDLPRQQRARVLGEMTLMVEFADSSRKQSLLRYAEEKKIEREPRGADRQRHVRDEIDKMVQNINSSIVVALLRATQGGSPPRPGCNGDLLEKGRAIAAARSGS